MSMGGGTCGGKRHDGAEPMFHFMIDLENTRGMGLQGAEYLCADDFVTIFYSRFCARVERGRLRQIAEAGSVLELCRLQRSGKNAMDYYIASRVGERFGGGYQGTIAIVSSDKGYSAVQDYWACCAEPARKVVLQPNIEQCIGRSDEDSARRRAIQERLEEVDLQQDGHWGKSIRKG